MQCSTPTPSCGRPPPYQVVSGPNKLIFVLSLILARRKSIPPRPPKSPKKKSLQEDATCDPAGHLQEFRERSTPLVNHAFARVTPAIFVVFTGSEQQSPCFTGYNAMLAVSSFSSKPPPFSRVQRHGLPKAPFFGARGVFSFTRRWSMELWSSTVFC